MPQTASPFYPRPGGNASSLNLTAETVVKASPGTVYRVVVTVAGTAPGSVYDVATAGTGAAATLISTIPNTIGVYDLTFPCFTGIDIVPGTGQTVSVSYS